MRPSRRVSFFTLPEVSEFTVDVEVGRSITVYRNGQYCQQFFVGEVVTQYVSRIPNFDHKYTAQIVNITAKTVKFHHGVVGHYEFCQMNWNLPNTPPQP